MPHLDGLVTHAGMNSVCEAMAFGVPIVALPFHGDQPVVADLVLARRAGVRLDFRGFTAAQIADAVARILDDPAYRSSARGVQESFREADGVGRALEVLDEVAGAR